nr:glycosyltransferase [Rhodovastum atsumiense]
MEHGQIRMIPKKIHYVWVGSPEPDRIRRYIDSWSATNPDYEIIRWNEENIDFSIPAIQNAYNRRLWSKVSDIARLMAVLDQGGIYLDTDFSIRRSLDLLLKHNCFFAFQRVDHPTDWVANGVFGATPGHWFIRQALDRILGLRALPFGFERPTRTGPKLITSLLLQNGLKAYHPDGVYVRDIYLCPVPVFFPFFLGETFTEACVRKETIGIHFWEKSWEKDLPRYIRLAKAIKHQIAGTRL